MAYVVLFGGGDAGGVILTEHGIKPIPPWNAFGLGRLRALSALVAARAAAGSRKPDKALDGIIDTLSRSVMEAANEDFGSLGSGGILFADEEDGVYCGTRGPVHVPIRKGPPEPSTRFRAAG
jgi:hypothetical protein